MLGAIIGDIVGSRFEFNNHKDKDFELFTADCLATDDTIMTIAVAKALMASKKELKGMGGESASRKTYLGLVKKMTVNYLQTLGRAYPNRGYGGRFAQWLELDDPQPYYSYGNGAAMRISPVAYVGQTPEEVSDLSLAVTGVTHNHPEGLRGAEATAQAIFMARSGFKKEEIRKEITSRYYSLDFSLDSIGKTYKFNPTCQGTVPQAMVAFLESDSFEDAIRNAISLGGDSDTLGAITGSVAGAFYGISDLLRTRALTYLDDNLRLILAEWSAFVLEDREEE